MLVAGVPVAAVVQGASWFAHACAAIMVVVAAGMLAARAGVAAVVTAQLAAVIVLLTALFVDGGVLGLLPGPAALDEMITLIAGAGEQIDISPAPVPATPEILFLVTAAFGLVTAATYLAAVSAAAPAAAAVPLLIAFAVPAALADELLPWWAVVAAAAGYGVLLVIGGARRQLSGGTALISGAIVLALLVGAAAGAVGTAGRFGGAAGGGGSSGAIGLNPFTALRGQLTQSPPIELLQARGLQRPAYLRALTLRDYVPESGFQAGRPEPGVPLTGDLPDPSGPGEQASVTIENIGFRDYWLPLYGQPLDVSGIAPDRWAYDANSGTAYTSRPRAEPRWQQGTLLAMPSVDQLRAATGDDVPPGYLDTVGVDSRVAEVAAGITATSGTSFDRAMAILDFFTAADSPFRYSLQTAPGGSDDALVEFLTVGRTGYCEQFASAMAVMLRTVGVPARVAVGFTAGTDTGEFRSVSTADAHAWVEAWFPGIGWTTFDPTPLTDGRNLVPPYVEQAREQARTAVEPPTSEAAGPGAQPEPEPEPPPTPDSPDQTALEDPVEPAGFPLWPVALTAILALGVAAPAGRRALDRRRRLAAVRAGGPAAAGAAWAELLAESVDRGAPGQASDTVRTAARHMVREHHLGDEGQQALRSVVAAVESSWYGDKHPEPAALDGSVQDVRRAIAAGSPLGLRGRLLPRSVLNRLPRHRLPRLRANMPGHAEGALHQTGPAQLTPARTFDGNVLPSVR
ncbi:MAG: transglutaminaseTgpA domain-containing protein [Pseudonocardia sp.]